MFTIDTNEIVIGGNLSALLYAYCKNVPFISARQLIPHDYEFFDDTIDLSKFFLKNSTKSFLTPNGIKNFGISKSILWHNLNYILSLSSRNIAPFDISSIKIDNNLLKIVTKNASMIHVKFKKLILFDDFKVIGIPDHLNRIPLKFKVYDWINTRSGNKHKFDLIENDDNLACQIFFYYSTKRGYPGLKLCKDIVAVSEINIDDLQLFEYSDTGVMFLVKNLMKSAGIKGRINGVSKTKLNHNYYFPIKLEPKKRELQEIVEGKNACFENIEIRFDIPESLISSEIKNSYTRNLHCRLIHEKRD